ncbi:MAG: APC family permease, partial [Candidatus Polarisedimenticolia bacterium]
VSLMAFLAWVGLGADGLSSSAYGPAEAFRNLMAVNPVTGRLEGQWYLAIFLALATATTVFVISYAYTRVIEQFPHGGGGYVVATKLLGPRAGIVSGSALLVDYALTITTSVAAGGDAVFNLLPAALRTSTDLKLGFELLVLVVLLVMNIRGVKESVEAVMPVFLAFVLTHVVLILAGIGTHAGDAPGLARDIGSGLRDGMRTFGLWGLFLIFLRAFALGGGTFTGIEAVSNGIAIMREPRVLTGKRTMLYMAASLAFTAAGILVCYLLFDVQRFLAVPGQAELGKTLNAVLADQVAGGWRPWGLPLGPLFVTLTIASEAALLFVAAQTGFIDGPRVMASMAVDSWLPRRFASLSDRLTSKDGVVLMGGAAIALLFLTRGSIQTLVVMYSINVFVTFSLTQLGMCRFWFAARRERAGWLRPIAIHVFGLLVCATILTIMAIEKFEEGAWKTLLITSLLIAGCAWVRRHYRSVEAELRRLDRDPPDLPPAPRPGGEPDPAAATAVLLVRGYGGMGTHMLLSLHRMFPGYFRNVIFVSAAVIDSGHFKGAEAIEDLRREAEATLAKYVDLARRLGWNAAASSVVTTDPVDGLYRACADLAARYPRAMFFGGKLIWKRESWWQRILHNETAYQVQRRLQWKGLPMTVIPLRTGAEVPGASPPAAPGAAGPVAADPGGGGPGGGGPGQGR